ncbi:MAG: hypothetical protein VX353_01580, partial [Actinomycetota bacterium]
MPGLAGAMEQIEEAYFWLNSTDIGDTEHRLLIELHQFDSLDTWHFLFGLIEVVLDAKASEAGQVPC